MDTEKNTDPNWPRWFYGAKGEAKVFHNEADVPEGWKKHPSEHENAEVTTTASTPGKNESGEDIDAFGVTWNGDVNTADKAMTKGGLWKLQPGKSRPSPAEGYPKETFDL